MQQLIQLIVLENKAQIQRQDFCPPRDDKMRHYDKKKHIFNYFYLFLLLFLQYVSQVKNRIKYKSGDEEKFQQKYISVLFSDTPSIISVQSLNKL